MINNEGQTTDVDMTLDVDDEGGLDEMAGGSADQDASGTKVIVIHPGSQNLRIGLASDALPKTVPMVVARRWKCNESEEAGGESSPKRIKLDDGSYAEPEKMFGPEVCFMTLQVCWYLHLVSSLPNTTRCVLSSRYACELISEECYRTRRSWL